jgi:SAM-dependent methyltransferase
MRTFALQNLYDWVEQSVLASRRGFVARAHLARLGIVFESVWNAYQSSTVAVDYGAPDVADAYRLHYLPHYSFTAYRALEVLPFSFYDNVRSGRCVVAVVAAGPLPEVIAIAERCALEDARGRIELHAYDIAASTWERAARESVGLARRLNPNVHIDLHYHAVDLRQRLTDLPAFDLMTFQHCINELLHDGRPVPGVRDLIAAVAPGGMVVFSDFNQYASSVALVRRFEEMFEAQGWSSVATFSGDHVERTPFEYVPSETFWSFYGFARGESGQLKPRVFPPRKILKFSWSAHRRP